MGKGGSGPASGGCQLQLGEGGESAKIGQQNEYSLHGGRYASCVHAGGLSCSVKLTLYLAFNNKYIYLLLSVNREHIYRNFML